MQNNYEAPELTLIGEANEVVMGAGVGGDDHEGEAVEMSARSDVDETEIRSGIPVRASPPMTPAITKRLSTPGGSCDSKTSRPCATWP